MPLFKRKSHELETTESPVESPRWNFELVEEINPEWLSHAVKAWGYESGKFIRVGADLVLVAPFRLGSGVNHKKILELALKTKDRNFKQRVVGAQAIAAATEGKLLDVSGVKDAGRFLVKVGPDGEVSEVTIEGESGVYGHADLQGREHTVDIVQQKLSPEIEVVNNPRGIEH